MKERLLTILAALALPVTLLRSRPANGPFPRGGTVGRPQRRLPLPQRRSVQ
jgi:hypothetical protein